MTWSAPIARTCATLCVRHTPVTRAPSALAICTANVPTPPEAPLMSTSSPGFTFAVSVRPKSAVPAATGRVAASSNETLFGIGATRFAATATYSWYAPKDSA